jgi:hypothetical protein
MMKKCDEISGAVCSVDSDTKFDPPISAAHDLCLNEMDGTRGRIAKTLVFNRVESEIGPLNVV